MENNRAQRTGSGFTNLSRVLQANQNNRLGSAISSGLAGGATQVRQQLGDTRQEFNTQSEAQRLDSQSNLAARQAALNQIASGDDKLKVADAQKQQFANFRSGQYAGPRELNTIEIGKTQRTANDLEQIGNQLRQADKTGVLSRFVNPGVYTAGQKRLDSTLLGSKENKNLLQQGRQQTQGLQQAVNQEKAVASDIAQLRANQAAQFGKDTNEQLSNFQKQYQDEINANVNKYQTQQQQDLQAVQSALTGSLSMNPEGRQTALDTLKKFSFIDPNATDLRQATYNIDPSEFAKLVSTDAIIDKNTAASKEQQAKLNALNELSGTSNAFFTDPNRVGTLDANKLISANTAGGQAMVQQQKDAYSAQTADIDSQIAALQQQVAAPIRGGLGGTSAAQVAAARSYFEKLLQLQDAKNRIQDSFGQSNYVDTSAAKAGIAQNTPSSAPAVRGRL